MKDWDVVVSTTVVSSVRVSAATAHEARAAALAVLEAPPPEGVTIRSSTVQTWPAVEAPGSGGYA